MRASRAAALVGAAACALAGAAAHAHEAGAPWPLAAVDVTPLKTAYAGPRPADAPRSVAYSPKSPHGTAPSCGLLPADPRATLVTPILEPGEDGAWPECAGLPEAATFAFQGRTGYAIRFLQRDTREDTYRYTAFVAATRTEIQGIAALDLTDGTAVPEGRTIRWMAAWAKARIVGHQGGDAGFVPSPKDDAIAETAFLAPGRDATGGRCRLAVDTVTHDGGLAPLVTPCKALLATAAVTRAADVVLLAMLDVAGQGAQGRVFVADAKGVRESAELERALAPAFATGRLLEVKAALKRN